MSRVWALGVRVAAALFIVWTLWAFLRPILHTLGHDWTQGSLGTWGDSFGALNALFTALGFSAVVATLLLQQRQNDFNEREQHKQQFDSSFFELLKMLRQLRDSVTFTHDPMYLNKFGVPDSFAWNGLDGFREAWLEFVFWQKPQTSNLTKKQIGNLYYKRVHSKYDNTLGPYFRVLYTILYRIKDDPVLSEHEKLKYGRLVRAQMGSYEVALCGLNGLSPISKDFYDLIAHFRLLKYLPTKSLRRRLLRMHYPRTTFEASIKQDRASWYLYAPPDAWR